MSYSFPDYQQCYTETQVTESFANAAGETPASSRTIHTPRANSAETSTHQPLQPDRLRFLQPEEWDAYNSYDEEVPTCLHYSIEWKVSVNNKVISRDTE
jgi:hypothetical protein